MEDVTHALTPDTQLFHDIFNTSPIGVAVENFDGQPLFVNPALCSMLGFSPDEFCGKHCVEFSPPEDAEKDWELFQQLRAGSIDHYQLEKRYFRRDGSLVWGSLSVSLLKGGPSPLILAMVEDITDKKRAEEARSRHAAIVESSEDAIGSVTLDGVIASWNRGAHRIFGYTEDEAVGESVNILVPPERLDEEKTILETLKAGGRIDQFETVRVTKTGKRIDVSLSVSPIKDSTGKTVGFCGVSRDISARKRAEEAVCASEGRLRLAQQAAHIGTFEWNIRTNLNTWTPELEAIYGLPPGGFGGTLAAFESLVYCEDRPKLREFVESTLKTEGPITGEWRVIWPDGSLHWVAGRWQVLNDESGKPSWVVGANIDVTERKRAEEALLEVNRTLEAQAAVLQSREELLRVFVKNVPAAVAMLDLDMRYLQVSDRWCSDYLPGRAQILGRSHYEIFPDMPERWKEVHRRALQGETLRADEDHWDGQDGPHWARWEVRPWKTAEGVVGGILILAEDITRRKHMEEALSSMSRKLIQSQEQERTRIGRELHDDINQRLAMLAIELERLQIEPSEIRSRLQQLREETIALSSDVQALSHELHSSKLEYLGVVSGMKSWCREFSERQKMEIDFKSDVSSPLPFEIGLSLFRVLQEGLHNAAKHSGTKRVEVEVAEDSNEAHLIVRDSGSGFDLEAAKRGSGLGLTSMQERLKLVHGQLSIESKAQEGTTIHARVPLSPTVKSALAGA